MRGKIILGMTVLAVLATTLAVMLSVSAYDHDQTYNANSTYFVPEDIRASGYCDTKNVEIWINTSVGVTNGLIVFNYDPYCANVTSATINTADWESTGAVNLQPGQVIISFSTLKTTGHSGKTKIADITIHCNNTSSCCGTRLEWDASTSYLNYVDSSGVPQGPIPVVNWANGIFICGKLLVVDKTVWNGTAWVDGPITDAVKGGEYQFRINVTAGCYNLTNVVVKDILTGVMAINCSTVSAVSGSISCNADTNSITWNIGDLNKSETKTMTFNATVEDYGMSINKVNATGYCPEFGINVTPDEDTVTVKAPVPYVALMYFKPRNSSAPYCNTAEVEVWVNSSEPFLSGQINLTYNASCANVTNWVRNTDVFPHGDWDSSKPGEEWITFARNDEIIGDYKIGTLTIHCNNTCNCNTTLDIVDYSEVVLPGVRISTVYDANMVVVKTMGEDGKFTCTNPDLIVTKIELNSDAPGLGDIAVGPTNHTGAKRECNNISATIKNIGNGAAGPFYVRFNVSHNGGPEEMLCEVPVSGLNAGAETTVDCKCKWYPFANENYTITVTADSLNNVTECDETNNTLTRDVTPVVNGYKGDGWQDGRGIDTYYNTTQGHFNVRYSVGDSYYLSGYNNPWTSYTVNWTRDNLSIPNAATIKKALLYVYYCWDKSPDGDPTNAGDGYYVNLTFNGVSKMPVRHFTDEKGFGSSYPFGMIVYDVTNELDAVGTNKAVLTYTWPSGAYKDLSIKGMVLLVVYEHTNEPERIIFINEGFDMLYAKKYYGVSSEEATTYAKFNITEDIWKFGRARLITIAPNASDGDDKNRLYFNDHCWKGVWDHYVGDTELGINETDVTLYIKQGENIAAFQSHIPEGGTKGDFMDASNAILILEKGEKKVVEIVPANVTVQPQDQFDIEVVVNPYGNDVYGVQYTIKYDPSVLRAESQVSGDFLSKDGNKTMVVVNEIDHATGTIEYAETRLNTSSGMTGRGTVAKIQFTAIGEPGATTSINITEVVLVDSDKQENKWYEVCNATVTIYKNDPPVILNAGSKHLINNAQKKYESFAVLCVNVTDYDEKGYNISYIRWSFGDGQYGTTEGGLPCDPHSGVCCICKNHSYITWKWNSSTRSYEPLNASVTVTDDGCPEMSTTEYFDVIVYMAGDANGDGVVNILDAVWIGKHFGEKCDGPAKDTCCGPVWSSEEQSGADLNNDCEINILDAVIVGTMWGHTAW